MVLALTDKSAPHFDLGRIIRKDFSLEEGSLQEFSIELVSRLLDM